jgi:signal transduction histidine kinase
MLRLEQVVTPVSFIWGAAVCVSAFFAQVASTFFASPARGGDLIWIPGGLLLAALMILPQSRWFGCVLGAGLGVAAATMLDGEFTLSSDLRMLLALTIVPIGANLMLVLRRRVPQRRAFVNALWFLAIFVIAVPAISAALCLATSRMPVSRDQLELQWLHLSIAHALGYLVFVPAWFKPAPQWSSVRHLFEERWWALVEILGSTMLIALAWHFFGSLSYLRPMLLVAPILIAVLTTLQGRIANTYVVIVLLSAIALRMTFEGRGPFIEADTFVTALSVKSWILVNATASWLLTMFVMQRNKMRRALHNSGREVRELAGRVFEAQEQERSRIARDLHDDVNQRLALVSIGLSSLRLNIGDVHQGELQHLQDELIALSDDVRHISHSLHPTMLHELGLQAALGGLSNLQRHRNGPSIDLRVAPNANNLPDPVALCIYRATQEALGNAIRHAKASHIEVSLQTIPGQIELIVRDDGVGFNVASRKGDSRGLGLFSLEERAKLLNGRFLLASRPGKGTRVCIRLPLQY